MSAGAAICVRHQRGSPEAKQLWWVLFCLIDEYFRVGKEGPFSKCSYSPLEISHPESFQNNSWDALAVGHETRTHPHTGSFAAKDFRVLLFRDIGEDSRWHAGPVWLE